MKKVLVTFTLLLFVCLLVHGAQSGAFMRLEEIRPGMKGTGRTIFKGQNIEEFQCEIIGVLKNIGPNQNAIVARLTGGILEKSGIFAGMSGSPVYIDGKLIGAVAWSIPFLTEPIAGITPIHEIIDVFQEPNPTVEPKTKSKQQNRLSWQSFRQDTSLMMTGAIDPSQNGFRLPEGILNAGSFDLSVGSPKMLRPITTPVVFSGFTARAIQAFTPQFQMLGLVPMQGGSSGARGKLRTDVGLEPGSTIAVSLVSGDMDVSVSGTVTHREGNRIFAFGHPFLNIGNTDMPLSRAEVLAVLPSLQNSEKLSVGTELVGAIRQDRATGIQGLLGETSSLIPVSIALVNQQNRRRQFTYQVINDKFLTPFLLNLTIYNTIISSERGLGYSTLQVRGCITLDGQPDINIENSFSSDSNSPVSASLSVAQPVGFLLASGYENLRFKGIALEINSYEEARNVLLERVWCDRTEAKPGAEVRLDVFLRKDNGEEIAETYPIKIVDDIPPGPLSIMIGAGDSIERFDARENPDNFIPRDLGQVIKLINNLKKQDRLYVRLFRRERGVVVHGEGLPGLPPSIYALLQSPKAQGGVDPIGISTFMEYELPASEFVISGMKVVNILVKP
jgi:hypothetical protein